MSADNARSLHDSCINTECSRDHWKSIGLPCTLKNFAKWESEALKNDFKQPNVGWEWNRVYQSPSQTTCCMCEASPAPFHQLLPHLVQNNEEQKHDFSSKYQLSICGSNMVYSFVVDVGKCGCWSSLWSLTICGMMRCQEALPVYACQGTV